jgi:glycerophosphoryl diester phosphodiesterase
MTVTERCRVIAHRGASQRAPENTVTAFTIARAIGADLVELDARRTSDGVVVVHHDARLEDGRAVASLAASALPRHIPTLAQALDACAGMVVNVEIKNTPGEPDHDPHDIHLDAILDVVRAGRPLDEVLVSSFNASTIARVHDREPALATAQLTFALDDPVAMVRDVARAGHRALHPFDLTVDAALVALAHRAGLAVNVWTVDDESRMRALVAMGVDGICTNVPDVARGVVDSFRG